MKAFIQVLFIFIFHFPLHASEKNLEKVTLQLQWKHQFEFAGFYMAQEKGFYKEVGLDVRFIEFNKKMNILNTVLSKKADYALGYSSIIADYLNGNPIIFIANFFKQSPLVLVTQKEITSLSQLHGAKIEGLANNIHNITLYTMLEKFGISSHDIETILPSFTVDNFLNKSVDAMSVFTTNEIFLLNEAKAQYNIFDPVSYGAKYYDANLFTSKEELLYHPKRVENFKNASIRGWEYALKHKEEAVELIIEKYNSQNKSKKSLLFESKQIEQIMLSKVHEIGSIDRDRVTMLADNFKQSGFIDNSHFRDIDNFIYKLKMKHNLFSEDEKKYLQEKKVITICIDPDWMPFSAIINHKFVGLDSDYIKIFEEKLSLPIKVYETQSWGESLGMAKDKKCDILSMVVKTKEREKYLNFTSPYFYFSNVIVTRSDKQLLNDMKYLKNEKVAILRDYAEVEQMQIEYPNIQIKEVDTLEEGLQKVKDGEVYGFIDNAFIIDYYFKEHASSDFKIGSYFDEKSYLSLGIRNDDLVLHAIMQKVIKNISFEEQQFIRNKWFTTKYKQKRDYAYLWQFALFAFLVLLVLLYRHYFLKEQNKKLEKRVQNELKNSRDKDKMIFHQSKLIAMGEMIENIAHQWRQPLSQVNSCVLVIDDILDEKKIKDSLIDEKLLEIESLTKHMSRTIEDFKNFFDQKKEKKYFYIEDALDKALKILSTKINSSDIKIIRGLTMQHNCYGHQGELQQAFITIINNAIDVINEKKIEKGRINIEINLISEMNVVTISDNAGGISEDLQEKIFEPYYTTKHKSQGTGLGLYISKIIIEDSLGGTLSFKNNVHGATFSIKLQRVEI